MKDNYKEDVQALIKETENSTCFDCSQPNPDWASFNNGIFLCISCAGLHRNLGLNISKIKSLNLDIWNFEEYSLMKNGGNKRLKEFLEKYEINTSDKIEIKYRYKIVQYYRDLIRAEVLKEKFPEEIPKEEEKKFVKDNLKSEEEIKEIKNDNIITNCCINPIKKKKTGTGLFSGIKNLFKKGYKELKNQKDKMFPKDEKGNENDEISNKGPNHITNENKVKEESKSNNIAYKDISKEESKDNTKDNSNEFSMNSSSVSDNTNKKGDKQVKPLLENAHNTSDLNPYAHNYFSNSFAAGSEYFFQNELGGNMMIQNQMNIHKFIAENASKGKK